MDRDLLPWILGGALITTGAIAGAIRYSTHSPVAVAVMRTAPAAGPGSAASVATAAPSPVVESLSAGASPAPTAMALPALPAPAAGAAADPASPAHPLPGPGSAAESSPLPSGQVWQCIVNGQKVFSDTRCGSGASVKQLGDLNVMDVPPPQYPVSYGRPYAPYPSAAPYPDDAYDAGDVSGDAYPSEIIVARERARRAHRIHQGLPGRSPPPAPAPHHGGAAPRSSH